LEILALSKSEVNGRCGWDEKKNQMAANKKEAKSENAVISKDKNV